ncbi:DNA repair and recombination protein RAD52 [Cucumispora dikerogammari]|nr:DNA repair and recombination protein RAD52 [Cucumispora dikerogammari]
MQQKITKLKEFTETQTQTISKELNKYLGPELISYRTGMNGVKLAYTEGWTIINISNKIFGFNGWSSEIVSLETDFIDTKSIQGTERFSIGVTCRMRVTLKDGTSREDIGFGISENVKSKGMGLEKAKKEAATDALKRAFRLFGNALGNCLYNKDYLTDIKKIEKEEIINVSNTQLFRRSHTAADKIGDLDEISFDSVELTHL